VVCGSDLSDVCYMSVCLVPTPSSACGKLKREDLTLSQADVMHRSRVGWFLLCSSSAAMAPRSTGTRSASAAGAGCPRPWGTAPQQIG
jgi:hypothetical protein